MSLSSRAVPIALVFASLLVPALTADEVERIAFNEPDSMQALYAESSFGKLLFEGDVFDGLTIPQLEVCDYEAIRMLAREAARMVCAKTASARARRWPAMRALLEVGLELLEPERERLT